MSGGGGSGSTNTTTTQSGPPQQFLDQYSAVNQQAQNVANTPYQPYPYQLVAPFSPDQQAGMQQIQNLTANGGVGQPYLDQAQQYLQSATQPLINTIPTLDNSTLSGLGNQAAYSLANQPTMSNSQLSGLGSSAISNGAAASGLFNQEANGLSQANINQFENPYTQQVINAQQAQFNNQNAQTNQGIIGNAVSSGAWGGDRAGVAQGIAAGQEQLAQAPVIANLQSQGYLTGLQGAQAQAGLQGQAGSQLTSLANQQGSLYGQGISQNLATAGQQAGLLSNQQQTELGANQANAWLGEQAGFGEANLGTQAQNLGLTGANALLTSGGLQQQMGQEQLNIPYEQYLAAQAYPYQTTSWLANIAEGLGAGAGGTGTTTTPGPSTLSQIGGLATGAAGILGATGAFGSNGYLSNAYSALTAPSTADLAASQASLSGADLASMYGTAGLGFKTGGGIRGYAAGGIPSGLGMAPVSASPVSSAVPDVSISVIPTSPLTGGGNLLNTSTGSTQTTTGSGGGASASSQAGQALGDVASIATIAAMLLKTGGAVPKRAMGGMSPSMETPWYARSEERSATDRHGLLTSSVAGRTDHLPISPASGSYVVPADVVSGLGEGNTLAGANVMQRILDTGPGGLRLPPSRAGRGTAPRPPKPYVEGAGIEPIEPRGEFADGGDVDEDQGVDASAPIGMQPMSTPGAPPGSHYTAAKMRDMGLPEPVIDAAIKAAYAKGVDPILLAKLTGPESNYGHSSATGAYGMPASANPWQVAASSGLPKPKDVNDSAMEGATVLSDALKATNGDVTAAIKRYNGTSGRGMAPQGGTGEPATSGMSPPSYTPPARSAAADKLASMQPMTVDPWMALAEAGFATAAGNSPHALQNIGAGALSGARSYEAQKQLANRSNMSLAEAQSRADQAAAQLAQTGQYQSGELGLRRQQIQQTGDLTRAQLAQTASNQAAQRQFQQESLVPQDVREAQWYQNATPEQQQQFRQLQLQKKGLTDIFGNPNAASATPPGADATLHGADYLKQLNPQVAQTVKAMAEGRVAMPSRPTPQQQQIIQAVSQYDPTFDATDYNKRNRTAIDFSPAGQSGKAVTAINTTMSHLDALNDRMTALKNGNTPMINSISNWWQKETGSSAPTTAQATRDAVANELRKVFATTGGGGLEELREWENNFPINASPDQQRDGIKQAITLMDSRLSSLANQYSVGMGTNHSGIDLLSPDAQKSYEHLMGKAPESANAPAPKFSGRPATSAAPATEAPSWKFDAVGAKGVHTYSNDGQHWFNSDGTPFAP